MREEVSDKMKAVVEINKLSKSFGKEKVLREISHSFETGRIHGIIGFNGSGKTVLFKCICGFLKPDSGSVKVHGQRIGKEIADKGYIPVVAHPERFEAIQINPDIAVEIVNRGGYLQMNKGSILGDYGSLVKETVYNLLENKLIHFVGSDAHNLRSRHPRMYESYVQVKTRFGSDYAQRIFKENGKILLNGGKV